MRTWRRILAVFLAVVMLVGILPTSVLAAESGGILINGEVLIENGTVVEGTLPAGVSYSNGELTLNNARLTSIHVWDADTLTLQLVGNNTIAFTGTEDISDAALKFDACGDVTIQGSGSLTVTSPVNAICFWESDAGGTLTITGGATVTATSSSGYWKDEPEGEYGYSGLDISGDLVVTGNATLNATSGWMGILLQGNMSLTSSTVTTNRIHIHGEESATASENYEPTTTTVGSGASLSVTAREEDEADTFLGVLDNATLRLVDGGAIHVHITAKDVDYISGLNVHPAGHVSIEDGELDVVTRSGRGIRVENGASFSQSGGTVTVQYDPSLESPTAADHYDSVGLELITGGEASISGNAVFQTENLDCGFYLSDALTISGGTHTLEGRNAPIFLEAMGSLTVVNGEVNAVNISTSTEYAHSGIHSRGGLSRFLGGTTTLNGGDGGLALVADSESENVVTLGSGMYAVDAATNQEAALEVVEDGILGYPQGKVIISRTPGSSPYTALMEVVNGGQVTAGTAFTVRMALSLDAAPGTVAFTLPAGISLAENSVTVNGQTREDTVSVTGQSFTVSDVGRADMIRFTAVAATAGKYSINATVRTNGAHEETLLLDVSAFTLSLPSRVNRTTIPVSGTAVPESTVTFYEGEEVLGTATANALGNWSTWITIPDTSGTHPIHAVITSGSTEIARSEDFSLHYDPNNAEVATLTVTNMVHGATDADPNVEERLVIDYQNGTRSSNYYTYWPDLPTFTFEVAFSDGTGTPSQVEDVTVVTTDWKGVETEIPLSYRSGSGTWVGQHDFDGDTVPVPEKFRVEWEAAGTSDVEEPEEIPSVEEPEEVIEDYSDGAFVIADALTFSVGGESPSISLTDSSGEPVSYEIVDGIASADSTPGELYVAKLTSGTFPDYPDDDTLYILIDGSGSDSGKSTFEYATHGNDEQKVYTNVAPSTFLTWTDQTFTTTASYQEGDVLILSDDGLAVVVTDVTEGTEGTLYTYEEAGLEDIYETLYVNTVDTNGELILEGYDEEAMAQAFLQSDTFAAYRSALETYAEEHQASMSFQGDGISIEVALEYALGGTATNPTVTLKPEITLESTMTTKLPGGIEQETAVSGTFSYELEQELQYQIRLEEGDFKSMFLTRDQTQAVELDISVTIGDAPDESAGAEIKAYFGEEAVQQYLQELEGGGENEPKLSLGRLRIPTNVPGLFLYAALDLEEDVTFFGELGMSGKLEWEQTDGLLYTEGGGIQKFAGTPKNPSASAEMEFHMRASVSTALTASAGVELWKVIDTRLYAKVGPTFTIGGHGKAAFGTDVSESESLEAELLTAYSADIEVGLRASLKISRVVAVDEKLVLFSMSIPIGQLGANIMPTRFQTIEDLVYVQSNSDLTKLLDLTLAFQSFTAQVGDTTIYDGKRIFDLDQYTFSLYDGDIDGVQLTERGQLTINDGQEREFRVKVTYTGSTSDYEIWKIVTLKYTGDSFLIQKEIKEGASKVAGFSVVDLKTGQDIGNFTTSPEGLAVVPATADHSYQVMETWCAPGYSPVEPVKQITVSGDPAQDVVIFNNVRNQREHTPDATVPGLGDPSGYVYEGIESNRIAGATVSLYQATDATGTDAVLWNAGDYAQASVLNTDALGQYLWMVPNGSYWQVVCSAAGYDDVRSEWLPVPPVQTGVNLGLTSSKPASMEVEASREENQLILRFNRPVTLSSLADLTVTVNGQEMSGSLTPVDAGWSVKENPQDSVPCATTFYFFPDEQMPGGASVQVVAPDVTTYAGTPADVQDSTSVPEGAGPEEPSDPSDPVSPDNPDSGSSSSDPSYSPVMDVSDGGNVSVSPRTPSAGDEVTITPNPDSGYEVSSVTVTDRSGREIEVTANRDGTYTFTQPAGRVTIEVEFVRTGSGEDFFADVPESYWAYDEIKWAYDNGYINGTTATTYSPGSTITRQQVWMILARMSGMSPADMAEARAWGMESGVTDGSNPGAPVTRQQLAALLFRYATLEGLANSQRADLTSYPDHTSVSAYAVEPMQWAVANGIIGGTTQGTLNPTGPATRAQFAVMLYRFIN